jgi:hypothetical protein
MIRFAVCVMGRDAPILILELELVGIGLTKIGIAFLIYVNMSKFVIL